MEAVKASGQQVLIQELSSHDSDEALFTAEAKWRDFWGTYCELLNLDFVRWSAGKRKVR